MSDEESPLKSNTQIVFPISSRNSFLAKLVAEENDKLFFTSLKVLVVVCLAQLLFAPGDLRYWRGPRRVSTQQLSTLLHKPLPGDYLIWKADAVRDTVVFQQINANVQAHYLLTSVGNRTILVCIRTLYDEPWKSGTTLRGYTLHGSLVDAPQRPFADVQANTPEAEITPYMFDVNDDYAVFLSWLHFRLFVLSVTLLITVRNMVVARRRQDPVRHPSVRNLLRYGDLRDVVKEIDIEASDEAGTQKFADGVVLTPNWLIHCGFAQFEVRRLNDLTKASVVHTIITVHKKYSKEKDIKHSYRVDIHEEDLPLLKLSNPNDEEAERLLQAIAALRPMLLVQHETVEEERKE